MLVKFRNKETGRIKYLSVDLRGEVLDEDIDISEYEELPNVDSLYRFKHNIECGHGWDEFIKPIVDYVENSGKEYEIHSIKEYSGEIFFDLLPVDDELKALIDKAIVGARKTCEYCGSRYKVGSLLIRDSEKTLCQDCAQGEANSANEMLTFYVDGKKTLIMPTYLFNIENMDTI